MAKGVPQLGLVRPGYKAGLVIVDGNPAYNLRFMVSFGAPRLDDSSEMIRTRGIVHTIKDGIVIENDRLMEEIAEMVARSKEGVGPNVMEDPFLTPRRTTFDAPPEATNLHPFQHGGSLAPLSKRLKLR